MPGSYFPHVCDGFLRLRGQDSRSEIETNVGHENKVNHDFDHPQGPFGVHVKTWGGTVYRSTENIGWKNMVVHIYTSNTRVKGCSCSRDSVNDEICSTNTSTTPPPSRVPRAWIEDGNRWLLAMTVELLSTPSVKKRLVLYEYR